MSVARSWIYSSALLAWGCGDTIDETTFPLRSIDDLPACARESAPSSETSSTTPAFDPFTADVQGVKDFEHTFSLVLSSQVAELVRAHAGAREWSEASGDEERGSLNEGRVVAHGATWGIAEANMTWWFDNQTFAHSVVMTSDLRSTVYDSGGHRLVFYASLYELDEEVRGCDERTGLRFERRTRITLEGPLTEYRCWNPRETTSSEVVRVLVDTPDCIFFLEKALSLASAGSIDPSED